MKVHIYKCTNCGCVFQILYLKEHCDMDDSGKCPYCGVHNGNLIDLTKDIESIKE